jgi:hypothetical protein
MDRQSDWQITIPPGGDTVLERFALDPTRVFDDPRILVWRDLRERQNAYMDAPPGSTGPSRLHLKRYKPPRGPEAASEASAIEMLRQSGIATVPLVAWGTAADGRGFLVTKDLTDMIPADRAIREGTPADAALTRIASLATKLHNSGLHHRDLYLCHFFIDPCNPEVDVHLIDPGRVSRLPMFPLNLRWIVKDLAQLCYSLRETGIGMAAEQELLNCYFAKAAVPCKGLIRRLIPIKVAAIARHDRNLSARQPARNISIR